MLVVIDESGCTGFKQGSSTHFVIGMIIFESFKDAEETANAIHKLRHEIGFKREFRFSSSDNRKRDLFFEAIKKSPFSIRLFVVEKKLIYSHDLQEKDELFINYCLKNLVKSGAFRLQNATVKIDGKGSRKFKRHCASYLKREISPSAINKVKFSDSKFDVLIQLADMVVSAYARPYNNPDRADAYRWRNIIERKIENVWNFK